jgi:hypothetical protein
MCRDLVLQPDVLDFNTAPAGKGKQPRPFGRPRRGWPTIADRQGVETRL